MYSSNSGVWPGSTQPAGLRMWATLSPAVAGVDPADVLVDQFRRRARRLDPYRLIDQFRHAARYLPARLRLIVIIEVASCGVAVGGHLDL